MRANIETKKCELPRDELTRIEEPLDRAAEAVGDLPAELNLTIVRHPRTERFHVEAALSLPQRTLFTSDWDPYLDTALCRSLRKIRRKADRYTHEAEHPEDERAERVERSNRDIVAPENPDVGLL